jgi:hypothetical protein
LPRAVEEEVAGTGKVWLAACDDVEVEIVVTGGDGFGFDGGEGGFELEGEVLIGLCESLR